MTDPEQLDWPFFMRDLVRGVSESPVAARWPPELADAADDSNLPSDLARWSGRWSGWGGMNAACDLRLFIRALGPEGATLSYLVTSEWQSHCETQPARFEAGELRTQLKSGSLLALRPRQDGDLEVGLWRQGEPILFGLVSRQAAVYRREVLRVPTPWTEQGRPVTLEMIRHYPEGEGPFPTVVLNHGSTGRGDRPEWFKMTWVSPELSHFLVGRGWQVFYPQRRGRGRSDGLYDEGFLPDRSGYASEAALSLPGADRALHDLEVAMAAIRSRGDVDRSRVVVGGVSRGGVLAAVYAGEHPGEVGGVLNFVGGWMGAGSVDSALINATLFRRAAAFDRPMLWLYGENDSFYPIAHCRRSFAAFEDAGGQGDFRVWAFDDARDGHLLHFASRLWGAAVEAYLLQVAPRR